MAQFPCKVMTTLIALGLLCNSIWPRCTEELTSFHGLSTFSAFFRERTLADWLALLKDLTIVLVVLLFLRFAGLSLFIK